MPQEAPVKIAKDTYTRSFIPGMQTIKGTYREQLHLLEDILLCWGQAVPA